MRGHGNIMYPKAHAKWTAVALRQQRRQWNTSSTSASSSGLSGSRAPTYNNQTATLLRVKTAHTGRRRPARIRTEGPQSQETTRPPSGGGVIFGDPPRPAGSCKQRRLGSGNRPSLIGPMGSARARWASISPACWKPLLRQRDVDIERRTASISPLSSRRRRSGVSASRARGNRCARRKWSRFVLATVAGPLIP